MGPSRKVVADLEVFDPSAGRLELALGQPNLRSTLPGFGLDACICNAGAVLLALFDPLEQLCLDLGELGRSDAHRHTDSSARNNG